MREGPEFVFWFIKWGMTVVFVLAAISIGLFWLLKRWSDRQSAEHDRARKDPAGGPRRP